MDPNQQALLIAQAQQLRRPDGISIQTKEGFRRSGLDSQGGYGEPVAPAPVVPGPGIQGTPRRPDQTHQHPMTGAWMTKPEYDALMSVLRNRQVPQVR